VLVGGQRKRVRESWRGGGFQRVPHGSSERPNALACAADALQERIVVCLIDEFRRAKPCINKAEIVLTDKTRVGRR